MDYSGVRKRLIFLISLLILCVQCTFAQEGSKIFFRAYGSYALPLAGSYESTNTFRFGNSVYTSSDNINLTNSTAEFKKNKNNAFGKGFRVGAGAGYIVSDFINLGLDIDYYMSNTISSKVYTLYQDPKTEDTTREVTSLHNYHARVLSLIPSVTYKAIAHPNYYFYGRLGALIGFYNQFTEVVENNSTVTINSARKTTVNNLSNEYKYEGPLSLGFQTALGIQVKIISNLRLSVELQQTYSVFTPTKRTLSKATSNDKDVTGNIPQNQKETEFVKDYQASLSPSDKNSSSKSPKFKIPYQSLGLSVGLAFKF